MKRFSQVCGYSIEPIIGQTRYAFALSNLMDFQDLVELATRGGCTGNVLVFYDLSSGAVFAPFEPEKMWCIVRRFMQRGRFIFCGEITITKRCHLCVICPDKWLRLKPSWI